MELIISFIQGFGDGDSDYGGSVRVIDEHEVMMSLSSYDDGEEGESGHSPSRRKRHE